MARMKVRHKRHRENSLAGEQNGDGSPPPDIIPIFTQITGPTTTILPASSPMATGDVPSTSSRYNHDYTAAGMSWSSTPTWITTTKSPHGGDYGTIVLVLPSSADWNGDNSPNPHVSVNGGFIAAPIIGFVIIVGLVIICLRNRKRQRRTEASQTNAQEMTTQPQRSIQPYIAPPLATSTQFPPSPRYSSPPAALVTPPPVILGPIPTGADSAYLTGIDTSDGASIDLEDRPADPFSDNGGADELPPPPYRPRSVVLPSFAAASHTHLVERSPFDDPQVSNNNDDDVSVLSASIGHRDDDARSDVSGLPDRHDADVSRTNV